MKGEKYHIFINSRDCVIIVNRKDIWLGTVLNILRNLVMVGRDLLVVVEVKTDSIDRASLDQDQEVNTHPEVNPK